MNECTACMNIRDIQVLLVSTLHAANQQIKRCEESSNKCPFSHFMCVFRIKWFWANKFLDHVTVLKITI